MLRISWIFRIQFTQNSLQPCHLRTRGVFRILSSIYNGGFCSVPCVALICLEHWYIQNLRNIQNPIKDLWCSVFLINPDIFRTLVYFGTLTYFETVVYSEPCKVYDDVFYLEPFVTIAYLDSWCIKTLAYSELKALKNRESLKYSLHRTLCNLGTFTTLLAYSIPSILNYSEPCQTFMRGRFLQSPVWKYMFRIREIFRTLLNICDK